MKLDARKIEMIMVRKGLSTSDVFRVQGLNTTKGNIDRKTMKHIKNKGDVQLSTARKFCDLLNCDISEIIADE